MTLKELKERVSSAGNTRGLIEARCRQFLHSFITASSAGNTRGLIEASDGPETTVGVTNVFRGEYPRPH